MRLAILAYDQISPFMLSTPLAVFGEPFLASGHRVDVCASPTRLSAAGGLTIETPFPLDVAREADILILPGWRNADEPVPATITSELRAAAASRKGPWRNRRRAMPRRLRLGRTRRYGPAQPDPSHPGADRGHSWRMVETCPACAGARPSSGRCPRTRGCGGAVRFPGCTSAADSLPGRTRNDTQAMAGPAKTGLAPAFFAEAS